MLKGNKGEWSEIYTLLKIVGDKALSAGDSNILAVGTTYPIISVIRHESTGDFSFSYDDNEQVIVTHPNGMATIPIAQFKRHSTLLLAKIKSATTSAFHVAETEQFLQLFGANAIKASSSAKSDIRVMIHDARTGADPLLGFSVKSRLGEASTLLNAGKTTNFRFRIEGGNFSEELMAEINAIDSKNKIQDRIRRIYANDNHLVFESTESTTFGNNLVLMDTALAHIVAQILIYFYTTPASSMTELLEMVKASNPLGYDLSQGHPFYEYKIKRFLTDIALGMMPSKVWKGELDATGGYLVVTDNGEVLCYHSYNKNEFEKYLLDNTKLETASSTKHGFGSVYKENTTFYFNLNLQIRFKK